MRTTRSLLAAAIIALALSVVSSAREEALLLGPEREDAKAGFAFRPPAHWQEGRPADGKATFLLKGPVPPSPPPTVSVTVVEAASPFDTFVEDLKAGLPEACAQIEIHSQVRCLIEHEHEAWRMDFSFADEKGKKRRTLLVFSAGDRYVVARYTCPEDSVQRFQRAFDASVRSFRVLTPPTEAKTDLAETYADEEQGFSLNPPSGWSVDRSGKLGPKAIFVGPKRPDGTVPNIVVEVHEDPRALPAFVAAVRNTLRKPEADFRLRVERRRYDEEGRMSDFLMEYTFTFNDVSLRSVKFFTAGDGDRRYTITCTAPSKWFGGCECLFHQVCDTFRTFPPAETYRPPGLEEDRYVNQREKFSLKPPAGWTMLPGDAPGMAVRFIGPPAGGYRPEMNVVCDKNDAPLEDYAEAVRKAMAKSVTGLTIHAVTPGAIGKYPASTIEFGARAGETQLHNLKIIVASKDRKLIFNLGARESDFAGQKALFLDCVRSLELQ